MLTLIRRIIVLVVVAIGLIREWPYEIAALRAIGLWAILYISSIAIELLFQYLSHHASKKDALGAAARRRNPEETGIKPAAS